MQTFLWPLRHCTSHPQNRRRLSAGLFVLALAACAPSLSQPKVDRKTLNEAEFLVSDTLRTEMIMAPDTAERLGFSDYAGPGSHGRLSDQSQAGFERARLLRLDLLNQLARRPVLPDGHPLARDLQTLTEAYLRLTRIQSIGHGRLTPRSVAPFAIDPFSGAWIDGPDLLRRIHRVETLEDAEAFVSRIEALADALDDTRRRLIADANTGLVPPRLLLELLGTRLEALSTPTSETIAGLSQDLENLMRGVPDITAEERELLLGRARLVIAEELRPAYQRLTSTVAELRDTAPLTAGIWAQGRGSDSYRLFFDWHVGSSPFDTNTLHEFHLSAVQQRQSSLKASLEAHREASPEDPPLTLGAALGITMQQGVDTAVPWFEPVDLTHQEALQEDTVGLTGVRLEPRAVDQSRPSVLLINATQLAKWPVWLQDLFLSSDFQTPAARLTPAILDSRHDVPIRHMLTLSGFEQGWASDYHTQLSARLTIGPKLIIWQHWRLIEAALAAADTGLHSARWTAEDARNYLMEQTALSPALARDAVAFIAANPGRFAARFDGARRLQTLRVRAEATLGPRYEETIFQDKVLGDGPRPFEMLKTDIETWYESQLMPPAN